MQERILQPLIYADIFNYPLTSQEIHQRLHNKKATIDDVETELKKLLNQGKVKKNGEYYFLPARNRIVNWRKKRNQVSRRKTKKAKQISKLLKPIPTIKLVGLTGSVAVGNAQEKDDLDFLIISSRSWLWTTRFLTTLLFNLLGLRRKPGDKQFKNKVCLNLFLEQGHLDAFADKKNLFLAYEVMLMKPLWQRGRVYQDFLASNLWVKEYLPNALNSGEIEERNEGPKHSFIFVDRLFFRLQKWWMSKRQTSEKIGPHLIAFHPQDLSKYVLKEYSQRIKKL